MNKNRILLLILNGFLTQWAFSQAPISCGPYYSYDNAGNRIQRGMVDCGTRMLLINDSTTSVPPDSSQKLTASMYPNPTAGTVNIVFNNPVNSAQITIADNTGRQLYNTTAGGSSIPINLSNFAQGIYYVTVKTGGSTFNSNIVKQ